MNTTAQTPGTLYRVWGYNVPCAGHQAVIAIVNDSPQEKAGYHSGNTRFHAFTRALWVHSFPFGRQGYISQLCIFILLLLVSCKAAGKRLMLTENGRAKYTIVTGSKPSATAQKAALILQDYITRISGAKPAIAEKAGALPSIFIGQITETAIVYDKGIAAEGVIIHQAGDNIMICGGSGKGNIYAVYTFIEQYLGCRKYSNEPAVVPASPTITLPENIEYSAAPDFEYREAYYPAAADDEYVNWHKLQRLDDLWGIWGHSFFKLVPPATYFKTHPEYFSLVNGKRTPTQLCLSNEEVLKIVISELKTKIADNPDAQYWSVSQNDDIGNCTCNLCKAKDAADGGPQGSLIQFVNKVAAALPDKKITTLAYAYTAKPATHTKPAKNVYIFLSDIDAYRDLPLSTEPSAATFRKNLEGWHRNTENIFIWDYVTQFTNYLAPFPDEQTLQPNLAYLKQNGVKGMFVQGSGETYSDNASLKSYLLAKLLWNTNSNSPQITNDFYTGFYKKAAPEIIAYRNLLSGERAKTHRKLEIYGNPINEWKTYLTPELIEQYSTHLDAAEAAAEADKKIAARVLQTRLTQEYVVLQQARFYGIEKHGFFMKNENDTWQVRQGWMQRVERFVAACKAAGVTELSEGGLSPDGYLAEWQSIVAQPVTDNKAMGISVSLQHPFAEDYPARGNHTLTDGNPGYNDFSYNWLCFYGVPMAATIDLGKTMSIESIQAGFLNDPRHRIFLPTAVLYEGSEDGVKYLKIDETKLPEPEEENYTVSIKNVKVNAKGERFRYIRVTARNRETLPWWRWHETKKPMIACDEIWVQ